MTNEKNSEVNPSKLSWVSDVANSKAAEKLADAVGKIASVPETLIEHISGPERVGGLASIKAATKMLEAESQAVKGIINAHSEKEIEKLRLEASGYVLEREMRKALIRRLIIQEAEQALPNSDDMVSDDVVSEDFMYGFFDEFDGISDPDVHKIAGRLLADEVSQPGSFPRRTLRVLRDLESSEFKLFEALCGFNINLGKAIPFITDFNSQIYADEGIKLNCLVNLDSLGLISLNTSGFYTRIGLPPIFQFQYGEKIIRTILKDGSEELVVGKVEFTDAGQRLSKLTRPKVHENFAEFICMKLRERGNFCEII